MNPWFWFAVVTGAVFTLAALHWWHMNRQHRLAEQQRALASAWVDAFGYPDSASRLDRLAWALLGRGWTVPDVQALAEITAGLPSPRRLVGNLPEHRRQESLARHAATISELIGAKHWPGTNPAEQIAWAHALTVQDESGLTLADLDDPSPPSPRGAPRSDDTVANARGWHRALGPAAPYAAAAGLSFPEAHAAHRDGTLDLDALRAMAGLRGVPMPDPTVADREVSA